MDNITETDLKDISSFLSNPDFIKICENFNENEQKQKNEKDKFNFFTLISDKYHKENLHSDILYFLLNPESNHNEGEKFLRLFLYFLNTNFKPKYDIAKYEHIILEREKGRIDVTIKEESNNNKRAIIIENKINDATDTERQLPKYYDSLKKEGYKVDMILYLSKDGSKRPTQKDWSLYDKKNMSNIKFAPIAFYSNSNDDLCQGWLNKCQIESQNNYEINVIIRHYINLLKKLSGNIMDVRLIEEFYDKVLNKDQNLNANYHNAKVFYCLFENFGKYLANEIVRKYENNHFPFEKPFVAADYQAIFEWKIDEMSIVIQINCIYKSEESSHIYEIRVWNRYNETELNRFEVILKDFEKVLNDGYYKRFCYPSQDKDFFSYFQNLLNEFWKLK
jgi:hypothetical protein